MADPARWTEDQMLRLAARGVLKIDLLGHRGTTLVTCDEVAAMAAVLALSGALPPALLQPANLKRDPT
ncbi:MAG: hypothetical protein KF887_06985 [Paracoccaceae bacterium]|nr:MAG: hypothetical protein KF887_06985 [Paracoccaceae bacterium]